MAAPRQVSTLGLLRPHPGYRRWQHEVHFVAIAQGAGSPDHLLHRGSITGNKGLDREEDDVAGMITVQFKKVWFLQKSLELVVHGPYLCRACFAGNGLCTDVMW